MESMRKNDVWMSKSRLVAIAAFALTAAAAGRVMADPTASDPGSTDDARIARRVLAMNRAEERASETVKGKLVSAAVWQLADRMEVDHADLDREFRDLAAGGRESVLDAGPTGRPTPPTSRGSRVTSSRRRTSITKSCPTRRCSPPWSAT